MRLTITNDDGKTIFSYDPDGQTETVCPAKADMQDVSECLGMANNFMFAAMRSDLPKEPEANEPVSGVTLTP